jgi:hypothetical protein
MTEDIIGWALVFGLPILVGAVAIYFVRKSVRKAAEATAKRAAAIEKLREGRRHLGGFEVSKFINNKSNIKPPSTSRHSTSTTSSSATPAPTSTIGDDLMTALILNQVLSSTTGAVAATVDRDSSGAIESYSWSTPSSSSDDDTPRKSSSWSSSSDSSSSWDSSSSSDIGSSSSWD